MNRKAFLLAFFLAGCLAKSATNNSMTDSTTKPEPGRNLPADSLKPIAQVLSIHTEEWMKIPGVMGTGETMTDGNPTVTIFVDTLTDALKLRLPSQVEGYPVVLTQTGTITPRSKR